MCHLINSSAGTWGFHVLCLLCFLTIGGVHGGLCDPGLRTAGATWPRGDIQLKYGQDLKIYCILDETQMKLRIDAKNSSDLVFFRNDQRIGPEYVTIINETTIAMHIEKPEPSNDMYSCQLRLNDSYEAVCLNEVSIGYKPEKPLNFTCVSLNWENLTCTWVPSPNNIKTRFSLRYKLASRFGRRQTFGCPQPEGYQSHPPNTCMWDSTTAPPYRMAHSHYTFILGVENVLGSEKFIYEFDHWRHVIPAKPVGLSVVDKTSSSVLLHWKVPYPMINFPPGLHHKVSYQSEWDDPEIWQTKYINTGAHDAEKYFNLSNLQYANAVYNVRVSIKSLMAVGEDKWSEWSNFNFKTAATLPGKSANTTNIGSFEIVVKRSSRNVYVYWQAIPAYLENGDDFRYEVVSVEEDGRLLHLKPDEITRTYAMFKDISLHSNFKFEIVAINAVGANERKATIHVPSENRRPEEPTAITKMALDKGLFELSWDSPSSKDIVNQTIFWCENDRDRPYQCSGYLDWITVAPNIRVYNITVPDERKLYQFAVSANTDRGSSGMVWSTCTAMHNSVLGKMSSLWVNNIESSLIEVGWKLKCSDRTDSVNGFIVYYCPVENTKYRNCRGSTMSKKMVSGDRNTIGGVLNDLKPYTTYKLFVSVMTKNGEGTLSDPIFATTLEAAPGSPENVIATVKGRTITIEWRPPSDINGVLRYYRVRYNREAQDNNQQIESGERTVIRDLEPNAVYKVSVSACTVLCGKHSSQISVWTEPAIEHAGHVSSPVSSGGNNEDWPRGARIMFIEDLDGDTCSSKQVQLKEAQRQVEVAQENAERAMNSFKDSCGSPDG